MENVHRHINISTQAFEPISRTNESRMRHLCRFERLGATVSAPFSHTEKNPHTRSELKSTCCLLIQSSFASGNIIPSRDDDSERDKQKGTEKYVGSATLEKAGVLLSIKRRAVEIVLFGQKHLLKNHYLKESISLIGRLSYFVAFICNIYVFRKHNFFLCQKSEASDNLPDSSGSCYCCYYYFN